MKSTRLHIVLCACLLLAVAAGAAGQSDQMIPVTLDAAGHVVEIPFDLDKPSAVSIQAFFPPAELGALTLAVTDAKGAAVTIAPPKILKPGSYSVAVSAAGASAESFSVMIGVSEPLDPYEPNDSQETASSIELPLRTVITVDRGAGNLDWFKFTVDQDYLLSVHLTSRNGSAVDFKVLDAKGKSLYQTASTWDSKGARYASLQGGQYYLVVGPASSAGAVEMELGLYDPVGVAGNNGGFIAVGMKEGSAGLNQLTLIAKTSGKGLIETIDPEIMKAELIAAVKEKPPEIAPPPSSSRWLSWIIVLIFLAAVGGASFWMRSKFKPSDQPQPQPPT